MSVDVVKIKPDGNKQTVWLSFADENRFRGVTIVDVTKSEINREGGKWIMAAIEKTIALGINPGPDTSVLGRKIPQEDNIPETLKNRLLNEAEANKAMGKGMDSGAKLKS